MQNTVAVSGIETKTKVFISYSRKDMAFADRLDAALKARGFEVLIDREEIYAFEDWWQRIQALIGQSDTVIFALSPDSIKSGVARKEVAYAASLDKRFAPIVCRRVEDGAVPEALRRLNFIFFDDPGRFNESADRLVEALRTDIGWIRQHTQYGEIARRWLAKGRPDGLLLRSPALEEAERWIVSRPRGAPEIPLDTRAFIGESRKGANRRRAKVQVSVAMVGLLALVSLAAWWNQNRLRQWLFVLQNVHALTAAREQALKPKDSFNECTNCPEMIVVPAGSFMMGAPANEPGRRPNEGPQHRVTFAKPFAVAKYEATFGEWDACVADGGCSGFPPPDEGWGRGRRPVINVNWNQAGQYVAWLARLTGEPYRLLTEAEYEYATRAGTTTPYYWDDESGLNKPEEVESGLFGEFAGFPLGDHHGQPMANCQGCVSQWASKARTAPVGSFPPNKFGLYDMVGNVWEWIEDCWHDSYNGAPTDGSAWTSGDCRYRVTRGGSWFDKPQELRSASRSGDDPPFYIKGLGFRVARTLGTP